MKQFFRRLFLPSDDNLAARQLYVQTVTQARDVVFYNTLGVPDTVTGRFDLISLHAFLVLNKLQADTESPSFAETYSSMIFNDMDRNLREMGVGDLSVGKKVRKLAEGFYGRAAAYRAALRQDDGADSLSTVLRRNIYADEAPRGNVLELLEDYVRRTVACLQDQNIQALHNGNVQFPPVIRNEAPDGPS